MTKATKTIGIRRILGTVMVCAALALSTEVGANELARKHFERSDVNDDEAVTQDEYRHRMIEVFFAADRDKDGALQRSEVAVIDDEFDGADSDANGVIELSEFLRRRMLDFRNADRDSNGWLDIDEVLETYRN